MKILKIRKNIWTNSSNYRQEFLCKSLLGGLIFLLVFFIAFLSLDNNFYEARDDGVITMSHARNWVDYGFIGVSPSGERVEGYSAPVQFFLYTIAYKVTGIGFYYFGYAQTWIATFILGLLFCFSFTYCKFWQSSLLMVLVAVVLTQFTAFFEWHGSGMENAITHALFLGSVLILYLSVKYKQIYYSLVFIVFLSTISRIDSIDSIYHIAPLLVIFSVYWSIRYRALNGFYFSLIVFVCWLAFQLWRFFYFGDLLPNTAYAQNISISERIVQLYHGDPIIRSQACSLAYKLFMHHGVGLFCLFFPLLFFVEKSDELVLLSLLVISLIASVLLNPFVFGVTRLDIPRSTTFLPPIILFFISVIILQPSVISWGIWVKVCVLLLSIYILMVSHVKPYYTCCGVDDYNALRKKFASIADEESLPRPTVSTPDLGVLSWHKQFNIVDLGMLGSPIMAKISAKPILADYYFEYALPDFIEIHGYWSCRYRDTLFWDARFTERYDPIEQQHLKNSHCKTSYLQGKWIRKDILKTATTPERKLIDDLSRNISVERLTSELLTCQKLQFNCAYVARTAYRFLPEFRAKNNIAELNKVFSLSNTKPFDLYLINGFSDAQAHEKAIDFICRQHVDKLLVKKEIAGKQIL